MTRTNNYQLIQAELNIIKLKPGLGAFYAIRPGNGSGLFSTFRGPEMGQQSCCRPITLNDRMYVIYVMLR